MAQRTRAAVDGYLRSKSISNLPDQSLSPLLFEVNLPAEEAYGLADTASAWLGTVDELSELKCFQEYSFLKIASLSDENGKEALVGANPLGEAGFWTVPGTLYNLRVIQYVPFGVDETEVIEAPWDIHLTGDGNTVRIVKGTQRVVGKYDFLNFMFFTEPQPSTRSRNTIVELTSVPKLKAASYSPPAIAIPLSIAPPRWMKGLVWTRRIIAFASVAGVVFSSLIAKTLSFADGDWVRAIALLVLILATNKWEEAASSFVKEAKGTRLGPAA